MWNQEDVEAKLEAMQGALDNLALNSSSTGLPKPQFFDGSTPFESYLRNFNRIATAHGWDPPRCTQVLPLYLAGPAKAIYESLPADKKNTWKNLLEALQEKLSKKTNKEAARRQLQTRKQKPNESLHEYSIIIKDLVGKAFPKSAIPGNPTAEEEEKFRDEIARDYFRLGLIHEIKERILFMEMPPTLEAAVEQAKGVLEIKESLQQETAINALQAETKEVIEKVKEEICSIRRDINSHQRPGGQGSSNQRGRFDSQHWQQNAQRQNFGQRGRGNFQNRGRGRGRGNFQPNNRFQPNQFRGNYQNQGQRQNYHNQYGQQNQRPYTNQSGQQNQGQNLQGNPNFEPIRNRFVNSVSNRSPSPILMPFLAISLILLASFTNANPTFQICPKNAGSIVDMPSERNCTVPNSDTYQNASVLIFLPKIKLKPFPIYKCWKIRSTVCTVHYAVYFHKNMPINVTEYPPSRKRCEELIWDKRMVQIEENLWTTGYELKYDWAVIGEECKNTTNEFIQKGQAVTVGNKVVMNWGGSFPFTFSGPRTEQTSNETYIWDNSAREYWETHQKKGPENAVIINNEIFVVESLQYAFFRHGTQTFEETRGIPKDAIRAENGAFIQIQEEARFKREVSPNGRIQPGTRPPKIDNRKRVQPQLRSRPTKMQAQRRTSPQPSTIAFSPTTQTSTVAFSSTAQTPSTSQVTTKRIETSILSTVVTQTSSPSSFIPSSTTTTTTKTSSISTTRRVTPTQWTSTQSERKSESILKAQRPQTHGHTRPSNSKTESSTANILELIQLRQRLHQLEKLLTTTERVTTLNGDDLRKHNLEKSIDILEKRIQEVEKWTATTTAVTTTVKRTARQDETVREAHENSKLNYLSLKQKQNAEKKSTNKLGEKHGSDRSNLSCQNALWSKGHFSNIGQNRPK